MYKTFKSSINVIKKVFFWKSFLFSYVNKPSGLTGPHEDHCPCDYTYEPPELLLEEIWRAAHMGSSLIISYSQPWGPNLLLLYSYSYKTCIYWNVFSLFFFDKRAKSLISHASSPYWEVWGLSIVPLLTTRRWLSFSLRSRHSSEVNPVTPGNCLVTQTYSCETLIVK